MNTDYSDLTGGNLLWLREHTLGLCDNPEGWEGVGGGREAQEGGAIHIPMADSC